jgi:hypothetical protein
MESNVETVDIMRSMARPLTAGPANIWAQGSGNNMSATELARKIN